MRGAGKLLQRSGAGAELQERRLQAFCAMQIPLPAGAVQRGHLCPVCTARAKLRMGNIKDLPAEPVLLGACSRQGWEQEEESGSKAAELTTRQPLATWKFAVSL